MMKRNLYLILYIATLMSALTACSESEDLAATPANGKAVRISVSPYPAFAEDAGTRSYVGTFDAGKTEWAKGDTILLLIKNYNSTASVWNTQQIKLSYDDDSKDWKADKQFYQLSMNNIAVYAIYAPGMTFDKEQSSNPVFKDGVLPGTTEVINGMKRFVDYNFSIDFSGTERLYSRLRIVGKALSTVDVTITDFAPATFDNLYVSNRPSGEYSYSLKTDGNGNAYLYGSWEAGAILTIRGTFDETEVPLFEKKLSTASENNKSYVADARLSYKNEGEGTAEAPYKISMPEQLASLAEAVNSGEFDGVENGIHVALESDLDLSDYEDWTPIGSTNHPFTGVFDGQGHTISNLKIDNKNPNDVKEWGLFGMVQDATIQFVRVNGSFTLSNFGDSGDYDNKDGIGGIAGRCSGTVNFYGCHNNVSITGTANEYFAAIGGIVGFQIDGHVTLVGCANTGSLQALGEGYMSQVATAGFIGTAYVERYTNTITAEANYCYAEIQTGYIPYVFYGDRHGNATSPKCTVNSNYWKKVSDSLSNAGWDEGFTEVDDSSVTWQTAMAAMNEYLSTNYPDFGYKYVENKGEAVRKPQLPQNIGSRS